MAIPTEEEFREFYWVLNRARGSAFTSAMPSCEPSSYLQKGYLENLENPTRFDNLLCDLSLDSLELFLSDIHDAIEQRDKERVKHPVQVWFNSQSDFSLATWGVFTKSFKGLNRSEFIRVGKKEILLILNFDSKTKSLSFTSEEQIEELYEFVAFGLEYVGHQWLAKLTSYLSIYYYDPEYWSKIRSEAAKYDYYSEMEQALNSSVQLVDYLKSIKQDHYPEIRNQENLVSELEQLNEDLEVTIKSSEMKYTPIKRKHSKTKDRELIYHLWTIYKDLTDTRSVTNIVRIMSLEGIESDYDERAVHKMIRNWEQERSKYEDQRKSLALNYPNTYFAKNLEKMHWN